MLSLSLKNISRNKPRTVFTAGGFAIGVLVYILLTSSFIGLLDKSLIFYRSFVTSDLTATSDEFFLEDIQKIREIEGFEYLEYGVIFNAIIKDDQYEIIGLNLDSNIFDFKESLLSGEFSLEENSILIPKNFFESWNFEIGEKITLIYLEKSKPKKEEFLLTGIFDTTYQVPSNPIISLKKSQEITLKDANVVFVNIKPGYDVSKFSENLRKVLNPEEIVTEKAILNSLRNQYGISYSATKSMTYLIFFIAGIGMFNTMMISVIRRKREIGILKSIGVKNGQIFLMFLFESILISLLGVGVGLTLGFFGVNLAKSYGMNLVLMNNMIFNVIELSILVCFLFSIYPSFLAYRESAMECLRVHG
ncbi:MAG: ABC transporter permease [Candidatus Methanofastidiosia archaeon]